MNLKNGAKVLKEIKDLETEEHYVLCLSGDEYVTWAVDDRGGASWGHYHRRDREAAEKDLLARAGHKTGTAEHVSGQPQIEVHSGACGLDTRITYGGKPMNCITSIELSVKPDELWQGRFSIEAFPFLVSIQEAQADFKLDERTKKALMSLPPRALLQISEEIAALPGTEQGAE